jgi:peptidoglycan/xylan/chitin deacetylase (PgdA/CDA1 family)
LEARVEAGAPRVTVVLLYHDVVPPADRESVGFGGALAARYKLQPEVFRDHLQAIADAAVEVGLIEAGSGQPQVAFSFDDGGSSASLAAAELERLGWRGHFFVPTAMIGRPGFMSLDGIKDLHARGHLVGSHSDSHPTYMAWLSPRGLAREWERSRDILADVLGELPSSASVPGGVHSHEVIRAAAAAGYRTLMTSKPTTRVTSHAGLRVLGRYAVWSTTPATRAAAYATHAVEARMRLWLEWRMKTLAKQASPRAYERLRRLRAAID